MEAVIAWGGFLLLIAIIIGVAYVKLREENEQKTLDEARWELLNGKPSKPQQAKRPSSSYSGRTVHPGE